MKIIIPYIIGGIGVCILTYVERGSTDWAWASQWEYWVGASVVGLSICIARHTK